MILCRCQGCMNQFYYEKSHHYTDVHGLYHHKNCNHITQTDFDSIEFESEESFTNKVNTLKESYFNQKTAKSPIAENTEDESADSEVEVSPAMEAYVSAIRKTVNK